MFTPPPRYQQLSDWLIHQNRKKTPILTDLYASLLNMTWRMLLLWFALVYVGINACFATLYVWIGSGIHGASLGIWWDAFHFSIQTFATIGYGGMLPRGLATNTIVSIESWVSILVIALWTGIVFAKFSRPTAKILFSRVAVIHQHEGQPSLIFRLANERNSHIIEARIKVSILIDEITQEGDSMRRLHDLKLVRDFHPVLSMSWTVIHPIDQTSPLFSTLQTPTHKNFVRIFASLSGVDVIFQQITHAHYFYNPEHVVWNARLVDILPPHHQKHAILNYQRFHDIEYITSEAPMFCHHCTSPPQENSHDDATASTTADHPTAEKNRTRS